MAGKSPDDDAISGPAETSDKAPVVVLEEQMSRLGNRHRA